MITCRKKRRNTEHNLKHGMWLHDFCVKFLIEIFCYITTHNPCKIHTQWRKFPNAHICSSFVCLLYIINILEILKCNLISNIWILHIDTKWKKNIHSEMETSINKFEWNKRIQCRSEYKFCDLLFKCLRQLNQSLLWYPCVSLPVHNLHFNSFFFPWRLLE